jgi:uncharacterized C2H2 Zn-finger protein
MVAPTSTSGASVSLSCIRLSFSKVTRCWLCPCCKSISFKTQQTAYKHVNRYHPGHHARTRTVRTDEKLKAHKRRISVQTSRRYLVKKRSASPPSQDAASNPTSPHAAGETDEEKMRFGVYTCTGKVFKEGAVVRCQLKSIDSDGGDSSKR